SLVCKDNQLKDLDLSNNTALTHLRCENNKLKSLYVSKNTALTKLYCNDNHLTTLDVSMLTGLKAISEFGNQTDATTGAAQNIDLYLSVAQMGTNLGTITGSTNNANVTRKQK
ncbi:MAG: cell surface protein, partial [Alistipes sp.]